MTILFNCFSKTGLSITLDLIKAIASGTLVGKSKMSLPAKKAFNSRSPGLLKSKSAFIFKASLITKPSNFKSFLKIS